MHAVATFNAKRCQLSSDANLWPLSDHLICLQHVCRDAERRAGLSAVAEVGDLRSEESVTANLIK